MTTLLHVSNAPNELPAETTLASSGLVAELARDRFTRSGVVLRVDGIAQSQVNPDDPSDLQFEYIQRIGHVIDLFRPSGKPITALHLGGGALTLPRYVSHTRPGSRSQVIEWERDLIDFVRSVVPWDSSWSIRLRYGDARDVVAKLPEGLQGVIDLVVVDLFAGNHTPGHLTTAEFYQLLLPLLSPDGVVVVNMVDGRPQAFTRSQIATLRSVFGFVGLMGESGVIRGRRFGNMIAVATRQDGEPAWWGSLQRLGPHPTSILTAHQLDRFAHTAPVQTDANRIDSPRLGQGFFGADG
jgi:hypothetical protein